MGVMEKLRERIIAAKWVWPVKVTMTVELAQEIEAELIRLRASQVDNVTQRRIDDRSQRMCG